MNRQVAGAILITAGAVLYAARHIGAMMVLATKSGDQSEQYRFALQSGGEELLALSLIAALFGLAYIVWGEYEARAAGR